MENNALTFRNLEAKATSSSNELNKIFLPILPEDDLVKSVSIDIETIMPLDMSISMDICNSLAIILKSTIFSDLSVPVILVGIIKYFALSPIMTLANSQQLQAISEKVNDDSKKSVVDKKVTLMSDKNAQVKTSTLLRALILAAINLGVDVNDNTAKMIKAPCLVFHLHSLNNDQVVVPKEIDDLELSDRHKKLLSNVEIVKVPGIFEKIEKSTMETVILYHYQKEMSSVSGNASVQRADVEFNIP